MYSVTENSRWCGSQGTNLSPSFSSKLGLVCPFIAFAYSTLINARTTLDEKRRRAYESVDSGGARQTFRSERRRSHVGGWFRSFAGGGGKGGTGGLR